MKTLKGTALGLAFYLALVSQSAFADRLVLVADKWCPYNCEADSASPGFMVELAQSIFSAAGHEMQYVVVPWTRAVQETRAGRYTAIIGATREDADDFIFTDKPLIFEEETLFVLQSSKWRYRGIASLAEITLGAVKDYGYRPELADYIAAHAKDPKKVQIGRGEQAALTNLRHLAIGDLGAIVENRSVFWHNVDQLKLQEKFQQAGVIGKPVGLYIAFSPAIAKSADYARTLSKGMDSMRKSGELDALLAKYQIQDAKPAKDAR